MVPEAARDNGSRAVRPLTAAQARVVTAARSLFALHGVGGTSLQMIADTLGVTKAAVYHQFRTKQAIVVASIELELGRLERALEIAEAERDAASARSLLLTEVVDLAVARRRSSITLQGDPVMVRLLAANPHYQRLMERFCRIIVGTDGTDGRVRAAMLSASIVGTIAHPLVAALDDDTLRRHLQYNLRKILPEVRHAD